MKAKNNTNKPIGIGVLNLLPGQTDTLPKAYENHPVVTMLATKKYDSEHTFITLIDDKKQSDDVSQNAESNGEAAGEKKVWTLPQLQKLTKAELEKMADELGITVEDATVKKLAEAIFSAQGAGTGSEE